MELPPGEGSLLAYFSSSRRAEAAVAALKEAGFTEVQLDRVSRYGVVSDEEYDAAPGGLGVSLAGLVTYGGDLDRVPDPSARVLLGADPAASGLAAPEEYGLAGGGAFLVTVVAPAEEIPRAAAIVKEHGGTV
ncbi:MAG: hypothetical protein H5T97_07215 [Firmicutes bacterium]|nr:hypothetical protein [Bacillota bacterium]